MKKHHRILKGNGMWKVFGLKILGALVDGVINAGGIGTRYRRSGIASALDKTADLLFLDKQAKRVEKIMQERMAREQLEHEQKSAKREKENDTAEQKYTAAHSHTPFHFYRKLLGLNEKFTQNELKDAYRVCAVKYHPDQYAHADTRERQHAEDIMKQINEAYAYLKEER
jgi:DnaJ-domain-containing protein 1